MSPRHCVGEDVKYFAAFAHHAGMTSVAAI
jgi:hypothetical protein